eukprot:2456121-Prymnesium_polylepis.1
MTSAGRFQMSSANTIPKYCNPFCCFSWKMPAADQHRFLYGGAAMATAQRLANMTSRASPTQGMPGPSDNPPRSLQILMPRIASAARLSRIKLRAPP